MVALLIEDNAADARLVTDMLEHAERTTFDLTWVQTLEQADPHMSRAWDVILLDLNLPDSKGLDTLDAVVRRGRGGPIVVLTGLDASELGTAALSRGAQDYLMKGRFDPRTLERSIQYAIIRHESALRAARADAADERAATVFGRTPEGAGAPARPLPFRAGHPRGHEKLVEEFATTIERTLHSIAQDSGATAEAWSQRAGETLARAGAGPRDVVEIYLEATQRVATRLRTRQQREAAAIEARLRTLEIMGHLADRYRSLARPAASRRTPQEARHDG